MENPSKSLGTLWTTGCVCLNKFIWNVGCQVNKKIFISYQLLQEPNCGEWGTASENQYKEMSFLPMEVLSNEVIS